jgi:Trypsin-co-occurring domain 2
MGKLTDRRFSLLTAGSGAILLIIVTALISYQLFKRTLIRRDMEAQGLGLQQVVEGLQNELENTELARINKARPAIFQLKDFDIELQVVAKVNDKISGKVEYQVVTAETEHEFGREATHKVTLHMGLAPQSLIQSSRPDPTLTESGAQIIP